MLSDIKIKGRSFLPLIIFFIVLLTPKPIAADDLTTQSVAMVDLESLIESHPLTRRINRLEQRIENYTFQYDREDSFLDLESEILARIENFSEQSYNRLEFIVENYNNQILRREELAASKKENLRQELEQEKNNKLEDEILTMQEETNNAIREREDYYISQAKAEKQEAIRDYNSQISHLELKLRFSNLSSEQEQAKREQLAELKEDKNSELEAIDLRYEQNSAEYIREKENELIIFKQERQAELESVYQDIYEQEVEEVIIAKEEDISLLEQEKEDKLAEELVDIEAEIDEEVFAEQVINQLRIKNEQFSQGLETLEEQLTRLKEQRYEEIEQLIIRYKEEYDFDLVIKEQLSEVSAQDLTAEIAAELNIEVD